MRFHCYLGFSVSYFLRESTVYLSLSLSIFNTSFPSVSSNSRKITFVNIHISHPLQCAKKTWTVQGPLHLRDNYILENGHKNRKACKSNNVTDRDYVFLFLGGSTTP